MKYKAIKCDKCGKEICETDYFEIPYVRHGCIWFERYKTKDRLQLCPECFNKLFTMEREDDEPIKPGHWIKNDNGTYSCSECKSWIPNEQHYYARYCLFCGAKMGGERREDG